MIDFNNFNISSFINRYMNVDMSQIFIDIREVKRIMELNKIRKTKNNINTCMNEIIEEIKNNIDISEVSQQINGNYILKR